MFIHIEIFRYKVSGFFPKIGIDELIVPCVGAPLVGALVLYTGRPFMPCLAPLDVIPGRKRKGRPQGAPLQQINYYWMAFYFNKIGTQM